MAQSAKNAKKASAFITVEFKKNEKRSENLLIYNTIFRLIQTWRMGWDSVTDIFLLKNSATPPRAVALRLSHPPHSRNDEPLECRSDILAVHCGWGGIRTHGPFYRTAV